MRAFGNQEARISTPDTPEDVSHLIETLEKRLDKQRYKLKKLKERRDFCTKTYEEEMEEMDDEESRLREHLDDILEKLDQAKAERRALGSEGSSAASSSGDDSHSEAGDAKSEGSHETSSVLGRTTGRMASDSIPPPVRPTAQVQARVRAAPRAPRAPQQVYVPGGMRDRQRLTEQSPGSAGTPSPARPGMRAPPPGFEAPYMRNDRFQDRGFRQPPPPPGPRSVFDRINHGNGAASSSPSGSVEGRGDPGLPEMSDRRAPDSGQAAAASQEANGSNGVQGGAGFSEADVKEVRDEVNAQMDQMVPHDGTPIGDNRAEVQAGDNAAEGSNPPRKVREWDLNKSADPQADMVEEPRWSGRQPMSNWADDDPSSPAQSNWRGNAGPSGMPRAGSRGGNRPFEEDFPGLRTGGSGNVAKQDQAWMADEGRLEDSFPSLGGGDAPRPAGAWGAGGAVLKERLTDGRPFVRLGPLPLAEGPTQSVPDFERSAGLRHPSDNSPDLEHKAKVKSKKDFQFMETIRGRQVNVMDGLELHQAVLANTEQALLERQISEWVRLGLRGEGLRGRTFSAPRKWARGKGRITIQFGCCYNYATDRQGRAPGIIPEEVVEPLPPVLVALAKRLVRWGIIPRELEPDTAIVNVYEEDDCIPPHIDHHDFTRPFCTISLLSEEEIMFGSRLVPEAPGVFRNANGPHASLLLPTGSCLILKGNGADVAMHCVPPVRHRRMSITLRKMGKGHSAAVKAEAARVAAGANRTARVNGPSDSWRSPSTEPESAGPPGRSVNLADLIVNKSSRAALSADKSERGGRWEDEGNGDERE